MGFMQGIRRAGQGAQQEYASLVRDLREAFGGKRIAKGVRRVIHSDGEVQYHLSCEFRRLTQPAFKERLSEKGLIGKYQLAIDEDPFNLYLAPPPVRLGKGAPWVSFLDNRLVLRLSVAILALDFDWDEFARDLQQTFIT